MNPKLLAEVSDDDQLVQLWLAARSENTRRAYERDAHIFRQQVRKCLDDVGYDDLIRFDDLLQGADTTRARRVAAVKSLLSFGYRLGYLSRNVGRLLRAPRVRSRLHERILDEDEVRDLIRETSPGRDRTLVRLLYIAGLRISEALGVRWIDIGPSCLTVYGKGARTRAVRIPAELVRELRTLRSSGQPDTDHVFVNRMGGRLSASYARRIVRRAACDAIDRAVSPHWLRHCHAQHSLDHGAPVHLVMQSLGHASLATTSVYLHASPTQGSSQYLVVG